MDLTRQKKINELVNENYVYAIQDYAVAHDAHDDELTSIRNITDNYKSKTSDPLPIKVLYSELQSFERELITHARVENDILFPKALMLEKEVRRWCMTM